MTKMLNPDPSPPPSSHDRGGRDDERPCGGARPEQRGGGGAGAGAGGRALGQLGGQRLRRGVPLVAGEEQRLMLSQVG